MTNHEVTYGFMMGTKCSLRNPLKFQKLNLNCIRFYLTRAKNGNFQGHNSWTMGSNKFSKVGQLRINFGPIFMNFGAIDNYL
jgi:hypothetical protein